ncbi:SAM-dependent methyltransferase [Actinomadura rupiterrae]|uniref:SAM-dependent methyltransferase n=1 Tax=Actinomadura rupiterrae TaxID=559627 RepID=UPI0020A28BA0|nr:SAM-dependent methyltransferase [Actinomadura rupiterrae]MCP2342477.1 SAM-dependent methyltransferase [Actinomadura rupiterrae]
MPRHDQPDHGLDRPASSRIYDFSLGGKDNYSKDRDVAMQAFERLAAARLLPRENRKFMRRAVRHLLDAGVRQFLDIGCGLPGRGNVHEVVHGADPSASVVYVDHDPVAVVHYRALLHAVPNATVLHADARDPGAILDHPDVARLIDFDRPVGVLMISMLDLIPDEDDPHAVVRAFRDRMAPGSHLAVCDFLDENLSEEERAIADELVRQNGVVVTLRPREAIAGYFEGLDLVEPGLVYAPEWRPDRPFDPPSGWLLAGVGVKP